MKSLKHMPLADQEHDDAVFAEGLCYQERIVESFYDLHQHQFHELELVIQGTGEQRINGQAVWVGKGSYYLLSPTDMHVLTAEEPLLFLSVKLQDNMLPADILHLLNVTKTPVVTRLDEPQFMQCRLDFTRLKKAMLRHGPLAECKRYALVTVLLTSLYEQDSQFSGYKKPVYLRQNEVLEYIHAHYTKALTVKDIAVDCGFSAGHLSTLFSQMTGKSIGEYIAQLRIRNACTLLRETAMSVLDIALQSGFGSLSQFNRVFRRHTDMTPTAYRRQCAADASCPAHPR